MRINTNGDYFGVWKSKSIIKSRDELCQDLEEYETILNDYVMSLLQNIIDLKISATEPYNELSSTKKDANMMSLAFGDESPI